MHADLAAKRLDKVISSVVVDYNSEEDVRREEKASKNSITII